MFLKRNKYFINAMVEIFVWAIVFILLSVWSGDYLYYGDGWEKIDNGLWVFSIIHMISSSILLFQWRKENKWTNSNRFNRFIFIHLIFLVGMRVLLMLLLFSRLYTQVSFDMPDYIEKLFLGNLTFNFFGGIFLAFVHLFYWMINKIRKRSK